MERYVRTLSWCSYPAHITHNLTGKLQSYSFNKENWHWIPHSTAQHSATQRSNQSQNNMDVNMHICSSMNSKCLFFSLQCFCNKEKCSRYNHFHSNSFRSWLVYGPSFVGLSLACVSTWILRVIGAYLFVHISNACPSTSTPIFWLILSNWRYARKF